MLKPFRKLARYSGSRTGSKVVLMTWILLVVVASFTMPSSNDYSTNSGEGSVNGDRPSEIAKEVADEAFPTDDGLTALLVFHDENELSNDTKDHISELSQWLASDDKPEHITSALPYHQFPEEVQQQMYSEKGTTLVFNVALSENIDSDQANETLNTIKEQVDQIGMNDIQLEITGPAGISADTIELFRNADLVLIMATVILIFIILIIIYRSPILAFTPLLIAGMVYGLVDRLIGLAGQNEWFTVDSQAVSIMLVLLFAVITDYSLFVFSRYREELKKNHSKFVSMDKAIEKVSEPIFFSGGTVFLAMLALLTTVFVPYHNFAPVFATAVVVILLAGLTLIPSIFALMGRKAFWPFIPKVENEKAVKEGFWTKVSKQVAKRPILLSAFLLIILLVGAINSATMNFSFNMLNSFPEDMSSRQGYELLAENYPEGQLAPVNVILETDQDIEINESFLQKIDHLNGKIAEQEGIDSVSPDLTDIQSNDSLPEDFISENNQAIQLQLILDDNPYEVAALDTIKDLRDQKSNMLEEVGLDAQAFNIHFAGQTAEQLDVREMNQRDMILLFSLVTVLLVIVISFQTRSFLLPILMVSTILLSYAASLGFSWWIFQNFMGYEAISCRLPVYTFIFMVALGIDYNIMLVSRIREKAKELPWKEAIQAGVARTGGVISSAGVILAATFAVLMTQPLEELFLFGFTMGLGILMDTFLIRGVLLPSLLTWIFKNK